MSSLAQAFRDSARETRSRALASAWTKLDRDTYRRETGEVVERTASGWRLRGDRKVFSSWSAVVRHIDFSRAIGEQP